MTIATTQNEVSLTATGNASEQFTVPFLFFKDADLHVFLDGTLQAINTNYTVAGAGSVSGGTITWVGTPTANKTVRIIRIVEAKQETDYAATGPFPAETHEQALDRLTMMAQQRIARGASSADAWDAQSDRIKNVADPTKAQDAATKAFVQAQTFLTSGSIAAPANPADDTKGLRASGGILTYEDVLVPTPAAGDALRALIATAADTYAFHDLPRGNLLTNGDFRVVQRGTSFTAATTPANNDDTRILDRWVLLSDGNDRVDVTQETSVVPTGAFAAIKLDVETVSAGPNAEKFGIVQYREARDSVPLQGKTLSLSFKARTTSGAVITNLRAGIVAWTGTADVITSDLVSAWNASGTNPTLATNWAFQNAPVNIALTADSFTLHKIEGVTMSSSVKNVAVFFWIDDTDHIAGDVVYITEVQLEIGDLAHDFQRRTFADELHQCQRFFITTFPAGTAPAQGAGVAGAIHGRATGTGAFTLNWRFPTVMHVSTLSIVFYNPSESNSSARNITDGTDTVATLLDKSDAHISIGHSSLDATDANDSMAIHATADAEL